MPDYQPAALERAAARRSRRVASETSADVDPRAHPLVRLQGHVGNASIARLIQRAGEEDELQMKRDPALLQRAGEEDELQMARDTSLVQRAAPEEELQLKHDPATIQREDEGGEAEDEELQMKRDPSLVQRAAPEEELQMKHDTPVAQRLDDQPLRRAAAAPVVGLEGGPVGTEIEGRVRASIGGGSELPTALRTTMESGFGHDFSGVRVHQDSESDALNRAMTAKAFTTGSDIFLRGDASPGDDRLMAHELTHIVQQSSGRSSAGGMSAGPADDPQEHEADRTAEAVLSAAAQRKSEETV
jgi:hypothetical protein